MRRHGSRCSGSVARPTCARRRPTPSAALASSPTAPRSPSARAALAEAERIAPDYVLVYQYQSNVAYLMKDRGAAIAALEKALALEPDNALFQANLEWLRGRESGSP